MFGVRLWHDGDLARLDFATFEAMKRAADQSRRESDDAARKAQTR